MSVDHWPDDLTDLDAVRAPHPLDVDGLRRITAAILLRAIKDARTDPAARAWLSSEAAAQMFGYFEIDPRQINDDVIAAACEPRHRRIKLDD